MGFEALDTLVLYRPASLQPMDSGFLIAEPSGSRVLGFHSESEAFTTYGRAGEGPGEFDSPRHAVSDGSVLVAVDVGNRSISRFDLATGAFLGEVARFHLPPSSPRSPSMKTGRSWRPASTESR